LRCALRSFSEGARLAQPPARKPPAGELVEHFMDKYYVYLLKSKKDNNFYIGQTNNIERRVLKHNKGEVFATKSRRPLVLLGFTEIESRTAAMSLEKKLKSHSDQKRKFIRKFVPEFEWKNMGG
jgi:putative endonuclease